jgi:hypothetical protein
MMLCKFGPKRLSPSLVVWQVRHALLNINYPKPASAPARASWGTADDDSRIRNVEQASPTIAMRGMKASNVCPCNGTRSGDNVFLHTSIVEDERFAEETTATSTWATRIDRAARRVNACV